MRKRTYYRGPDAVVTDELFLWNPPAQPSQTVVLRELRSVGLVRTGFDGRAFVPLLLTIAVAALVTAFTVLEPPTAYTVEALAVIVPGGLAAVAWRTRTKRWELHATYRGAEVVLYSSADDRVFNQVTRALRRAMENVGPSTTGVEVAAA
jgi:hypothetical protein